MWMFRHTQKQADAGLHSRSHNVKAFSLIVLTSDAQPTAILSHERWAARLAWNQQVHYKASFISDGLCVFQLHR